jgi:hypothetical protein
MNTFGGPPWTNTTCRPNRRGAKSREIEVIAEAHRIASLADDERIVVPIRDPVELIVDIIKERARFRMFRDNWLDGIEREG